MRVVSLKPVRQVAVGGIAVHRPFVPQDKLKPVLQIGAAIGSTKHDGKS